MKIEMIVMREEVYSHRALETHPTPGFRAGALALLWWSVGVGALGWLVCVSKMHLKGVICSH